MKNNFEGESYCNTTLDVLYSKIVLNTIIKIYKSKVVDKKLGDKLEITNYKRNGLDLFLNKFKNSIGLGNEISENDRENLNKFIIFIFKEDILYNEFRESLREKYLKFAGKNPGVYDRTNIMAALTSLDYIRNTILLLPVSSNLDDVNKKIIDVLNYDSHYGPLSIQTKRQILINMDAPLLDECGNEVQTPYDFSPEYIFSPMSMNRTPRIFLVQLEGYQDPVFISRDGKVIIYGKNDFVSPDDISKVYALKNTTFFSVLNEDSIYDLNGNKLLDTDGNEILDIKNIVIVGDEEYLEVVSQGDSKPHYISIDSNHILCVNEDPSRKVRKIASYNNETDLYSVRDDRGITLIDKDGNERSRNMGNFNNYNKKNQKGESTGLKLVKK